ncbi:hypothetical protein BH10ACT3_BH10ACT3_04970 [soil metagenome]
MQRLLTRGAIVLAVGLAALGLTACNKYGLTGHIDGSSNTEFDTTISGWANAADPKFDFIEDQWTTVVFADKKPVVVVDNVWVERPDVVKAIGPNSWGYEVTVEGLPFGNHDICVDVVPLKDAEKATADSSLECKEMFIPHGSSLAHFDETTVADDNLELAGWVYNSPYQADGPWTPVLLVDDEIIDGGLTEGTRTDVSTFLHEPADTVSGLDIVVTALDQGAHDVCLGLLSADEIDFQELDCVEVLVQT